MLKVHSQFKKYGIGFAETIKDLVAEGFVEDCKVPELKLILLYNADEDEIEVEASPYFITIDGAEYNVTFEEAFRDCQLHSLQFCVVVCEENNSKLEPIGFIYK